MNAQKRDSKLIAALSDYYSSRQAAKILGIYEQSLRKAIEQRRLKATKIGRDWFVHKDDLTEYQQAQSSRKTAS